MTIWGALITALATVLPAIGPLVGLDITPELVRQLGDQVVARRPGRRRPGRHNSDDLRPRSRHNLVWSASK